MKAIETWKHLLMGSPHPVIVQCDHKNLGFYKKTNKVTPCQVRWLTILQDYDLLWEYTPRSKLIQADTLSRRPDYIDENDNNDEEYYVLIPPEQIILKLMMEYNDRVMEKHIRLILDNLDGEIIEKT